MKIYRCQACDQVVYFENTQCMACGAPLGFLSDHQLLTSLEATQEGGVWRALAPPAQGQLYRMCQNSAHGVISLKSINDAYRGEFRINTNMAVSK